MPSYQVDNPEFGTVKGAPAKLTKWYAKDRPRRAARSRSALAIYTERWIAKAAAQIKRK